MLVFEREMRLGRVSDEVEFRGQVTLAPRDGGGLQVDPPELGFAGRLREEPQHPSGGAPEVQYPFEGFRLHPGSL